MGRVRVRYNRLPRIAAALPGEVEEAVTESARDLANTLDQSVWRDTGVVASTVTATDSPGTRAVVGVGRNGGRGFYARFKEHGTSKMPADPRVGPAAHQHEPAHASHVADAVRRATT